MKSKFIISPPLIFVVLILQLFSSPQGSFSPDFSPPIPSTSPDLCTSLCLDNGDHCIFGTNLDNILPYGMLFVNKRHVSKTTWDPSTSGEYARWVSRYGSVTVNFVGYQMTWAGMNEAGLMISTMSLNETEGPAPDNRLPFQSPFWMQYQLDNHSKVEQVIASDAVIRPVESVVDHYLVCDRDGACATIEFLEGVMVVHIGESLPVKALTNSTYDISLRAMEEIRQGGGEGYGNSIHRFVTAADRLMTYRPSNTEAAINYAFDTLEAVSREDTVWSFVYDPLHLLVYFRTTNNPDIRYLDFSNLDFSCQSQVVMLDVHAKVKGDIHDDLVAYTHGASFRHINRFFSEYEGMTLSPILVDTLLWGMESFSCQAGETEIRSDLQLYKPWIPPTVNWAGRMALHRVGPAWALLVGLSFVILFWRMAADKLPSTNKRNLWIFVTILLGPIGLSLYLVARRRRRLPVSAR